MKFRGHKYTCEMQHGRLSHTWSLRGPEGGVHFHFSEWTGPDADERTQKYGGPTAGLEIHRLSPAEYQKNDAPSHAPCWLLGAPCWHDGTSAYATDQLLPIIQSLHGDHPAIFSVLEREYLDHFEGPEND